MNNHKRQYKAGPRDNPTVTERIKDYKNRRQNTRRDNFGAGRNILFSESPQTPTKPQRTKQISNIVDRNQKLKEYRLAKNEKLFQKAQDEKSPFILAVPVGRWVEKKERAPIFKGPINTPVKNALMNERVLKKSTVKSIIAKSAKKENVMVFGKQQNAKPQAMKSKKQILSQFNSVEENIASSKSLDLNSTFEILPDLEDEEPRPALRRSNSMPLAPNVPPPKSKKPLTPPVKKVKAVVKMPVKRPPTQLKTSAATKKMLPAPAKKTVTIKRSTSAPLKKPIPPKLLKAAATAALKEDKPDEPEMELSVDNKIMSVPKEEEAERSEAYNLYKSFIDLQSAGLAMQVRVTDKDSFVGMLSEEDQTYVQKTLLQAHWLQNDRLQKFREFLEKFESELNDTSVRTRTTVEDVENYWFLVYEDIQNFKAEFVKVQELKNGALAVASQKKRRTRRTYMPEEGTPMKRSRRIAENAETPKHNASCYGCVTLSASKVNTPRSNKRFTTKKSLADGGAATPKHSNRRSSKHIDNKPKRLVRMNAFEGEDQDLELEDLL